VLQKIEIKVVATLKVGTKMLSVTIFIKRDTKKYCWKLKNKVGRIVMTRVKITVMMKIGSIQLLLTSF